MYLKLSTCKDFLIVVVASVPVVCLEEGNMNVFLMF